MTREDWWRLWWESFHARLNPRGAWLGVIFVPGPVLLGVSQMPGMGRWCLWTGAALTLAPFLFVGIQFVRAYPKVLSSQEAVGRKLTLTALEKLPPGCVKVALVGVGKVGKTTLLEHLAALEQTKAETFTPELAVFQVPPPVNWLVYLDARGQDLTQQFEIMDYADLLVLLLDHNAEAAETISTRRIVKQIDDVDQLINKTRRRTKGGSPVRAVHLLRNKHDLWSRQPAAEVQKLLAWFNEELEKVRAVMPAGTVTDADHSNERTADIAAVRARIMALAEWVVEQRADERAGRVQQDH